MQKFDQLETRLSNFEDSKDHERKIMKIHGFAKLAEKDKVVFFVWRNSVLNRTAWKLADQLIKRKIIGCHLALTQLEGSVLGSFVS